MTPAAALNNIEMTAGSQWSPLFSNAIIESQSPRRLRCPSIFHRLIPSLRHRRLANPSARSRNNALAASSALLQRSRSVRRQSRGRLSDRCVIGVPFCIVADGRILCPRPKSAVWMWKPFSRRKKLVTQRFVGVGTLLIGPRQHGEGHSTRTFLHFAGCWDHSPPCDRQPSLSQKSPSSGTLCWA